MRARFATIQWAAGALLLGSLLLAALLPSGCETATPARDGQRLQNAEVMFLTRGSLKGILTPTG